MGTNSRPTRLTVLIVDDDPRYRSMSATVLRNRGMDVIEASDLFPVCLGRYPRNVVSNEEKPRMPIWMLRLHAGGRVAIRMQRRWHRTRRLILDDSHLYVMQEEWRCDRCDRWVERGAVIWVKSGKAVSEVPEVSPFCAACGTTPPAQRPV